MTAPASIRREVRRVIALVAASLALGCFDVREDCERFCGDVAVCVASSSGCLCDDGRNRVVRWRAWAAKRLTAAWYAGACWEQREPGSEPLSMEDLDWVDGR